MPEHRGTEVIVDTWFERDRAMVRVLDAASGRELACWWDRDVEDLVHDGFLDPRDWAGSAESYLRHLGILKV